MRALLCAALLLMQQQPEPTTTAIVGARIVIDPATTIEKGTIVLRDGLISAVGADVKPPPDAEVIDGTGLTVYAGFIDAHTNLGMAGARRTDEQRKQAEDDAVDFTKGALAGMESANRKGLRPELMAADAFVMQDGDIRKWQRGGFTAASIAAPEEYIAGRGATLSLTGSARRRSLFQDRPRMYGAFKSYSEGYPNTAFGVLAHVRQFFLDARHYRALHDQGSAKPEGKRPPTDASLDALWSAMNARIPFFWEAHTWTEISRAVALSEDLAFPIVIVGGEQAYKVVEMLKAKKIAVILSLKWPKEPEDKKDEGDEPVEQKPQKLKDHEKAEWEDRVRCAIKLHEAGVPFAFSTQGIEPGDVLGNVEKLTSRGLPGAAALNALTTSSAALLGLETQLGRIAAGRSAHLTVLAGKLGDKDAKVKYVFVDGVKVDFDKEKPEIDVNGTWTITSKGFTGTFTLKQSGAKLSGTVKSGDAEADVTGKAQGRGIELEFTLTGKKYAFKAEMKRKKLSGTFKGPDGADIEWSAAKPD